MIIKLHKYLIIGSASEVDRFFAAAQRAAFIEFIGPSHKKRLEMPEEAKTILAAIKIGKGYAASSRESPAPTLDPVQLAGQIVQCKEDYEKYLEEQRMLHAEIARVAAFGDFSRAEVDQIERDGNRVIQFFCMKSDWMSEISLPPEVIYVGTDYELAYFVAINKERTQYPKMIEITIEKPLGELQKRLREVQLALLKMEEEFHQAAKALPYLQSGLFAALNEHHLQLAKYDAVSPLDSSLFAIEAWVPKTKIKALYGLLSGLDVYAEEIAIEAHDRIPTYQENKGVAKIGEDLVQVYDIPSSADADPSLWVLIFFSLFFAIIVSDAGYGLIYLGLAIFLKWKYKHAAGMLRRFIKLMLIVSASCVIWGVITASFFGLEIGPNNPFRKMSFIHALATKKADYHIAKKDDVYQEYLKQFPAIASATDGHEFFLKASRISDGTVQYEALNDFYDAILLEFSLLIGLIHISLSFIRYMTRNWVGLGWIFFMVGGYLYFPSFLDATSILNFLGWISKPLAYAIGPLILYTGLGLVFVIALLQKRKWGALHELTNAVQVFADVLSYLRLYALSLAGMIMASTFNDLGVKAGVVGGFAIVLVGHFVNLNLTVMSGTIHGLRLNFLEWYHYSFEGGGRLFNPLRIRKVIHK